MTPQALQAATACDARARRPLFLGAVEVGSVAIKHLPALAALARQHPLLSLADEAVHWAGDADEAALHQINLSLRDQGLIVAWRDERFAVVDPRSQRLLTHIERAASRFWGTLSFGAHANGYVTDDDGRPSHLWIARRSPHKATDPGLYDNLVGGGVAAGQSPHQALLREAWEEAGLRPAQLLGLTAAGALRLRRDIPEGLQHEWLYVFDVELPAGLRPSNQDGEVAGFELLPLKQALDLACGPLMTVDAALVTLDFAQRHGRLPDPELAAGLAALRVVLAN